MSQFQTKEQYNDKQRLAHITLLKKSLLHFKSFHLGTDVQIDNYTNSDRKRLYSTLELLCLDWEEEYELEVSKLDDVSGVKALVEELRACLCIRPIKRPFRWWYWIDICVRFLGVHTAIILISLTAAPLIIILKTIEDIVQWPAMYRISVLIRRIAIGLVFH